MAPLSHSTIAFLLVQLLPLAVLSGCQDTPQPSSFPPDHLPWQPLSLPRSELKVPALLVGDNQIPSSACFVGASVTTGQAVNSGSWTFETNDKLDASLKASLKNAIVDTKLAAEFDRAQSKKWKIEVTGLSYDAVDPASVQANFDNEACTDADLNWFKKQQFVATQALRAATVSVKADSALNESEKLQLDAAIDKINAEFHTSFSHSANTANTASFTASNVYIGVNGTTLGSFACSIQSPLEMAADVQTSICDGKYLVALSKSGMNGRYTLKVTPQRAATSELDAPLGSQAMLKLGKLQVLFAMAHAAGDKFILQTFDVLKVGAKG